jgi:hypothetical protein
MFWTEDVTVRRALGQSLSGSVAARRLGAVAAAARLIYQRLTKNIVSPVPRWRSRLAY